MSASLAMEPGAVVSWWDAAGGQFNYGVVVQPWRDPRSDEAGYFVAAFGPSLPVEALDVEPRIVRRSCAQLRPVEDVLHRRRWESDPRRELLAKLKSDRRVWAAALLLKLALNVALFLLIVQWARG